MSTPHAIALRGDPSVAAGAAPLLLARSEEDFIEALLDDLRAGPWTPQGWPASIAGSAIVPAGGALRTLLQPIHRSFNLVLMDAACLQVGRPRLDPRRIDSAGLVVRRYGGSAATDQGLDDWRLWQRWVSAGKRKLGWKPFRSEAEYRADPDHERRTTPRAGQVEIDRLLALRFALAAEDEAVSPLFVAPPEVCRAAGRTLLYGVVPTGAEAADAVESLGYGALHGGDAQAADLRERLRNHVHDALRATTAVVLPRALQRFSADWLRPETLALDAGLAKFVALLRQLAFEFDAFGASAASQQLFAALQALRVQTDHPEPTGRVEAPAGEFLRACARVMTEDGATGPLMAHRLLAGSAAQREAIFAATLAALEARAADAAPAVARYDAAAARYAVRCFVRLKPEHAGCPAQLEWSAPSALFQVAPWYAPSGRPPLKIALPPLDARAMKPSVAFAVPDALQSLLQGNSPDDFIKGKAGKKPGIGLGWLCSFNIPVITLCAFIVLNIFLQLFDLILRWLMFVKICLPIPKKED